MMLKKLGLVTSFIGLTVGFAQALPVDAHIKGALQAICIDQVKIGKSQGISTGLVAMFEEMAAEMDHLDEILDSKPVVDLSNKIGSSFKNVIKDIVLDLKALDVICAHNSPLVAEYKRNAYKYYMANKFNKEYSLGITFDMHDDSMARLLELNAHASTKALKTFIYACTRQLALLSTCKPGKALNFIAELCLSCEDISSADLAKYVKKVDFITCLIDVKRKTSKKTLGNPGVFFID